MFYVNLIMNKDKTSKDVFHYPKMKLIPEIKDNQMQIFIQLFLYSDFLIPNNSLLLDLKTNFGDFQNIALNKNADRSANYNAYYEGTLLFNLADNKELSNKLQEDKELLFYPKFKVDKDSFNAANLTPTTNNVDYFIKKLSFLDESIIEKECYYYSNYYSLHDVANRKIEKNQINRPGIDVPIFNKSLNYDSWVTLHDFINFYFINAKSKIEWLEFKMNYALNRTPNTHKTFEFKLTNQIKKDKLYTEYDYTKNEVVLSDKLKGYKGIFIPYASSGIIKLNFKINAITYGQEFDFKLNQDLFGSDDAKFKVSLKSYEQSS